MLKRGEKKSYAQQRREIILYLIGMRKNRILNRGEKNLMLDRCEKKSYTYQR